MPTQSLGVVPAGLNSQLEPLPFSRRMRFPRDPAGMSIPGFSAQGGGPAVQPPRCGEGAARVTRGLHAGYTAPASQRGPAIPPLPIIPPGN